MTYLGGNPCALQTFLVIGGFLTAYIFMLRSDKDDTSSGVLFFKGIVGRYCRLAPVQALVILFHSTWLYRLGSGPFGDHINYTEKQFCLENWWTNLLFIDNCWNVDRKCLIHSFYLEADFWLRILAILCLVSFIRKPVSRVWILGRVLCFSLIAFGYTVYDNNLEAIAIFPPE